MGTQCILDQCKKKYLKNSNGDISVTDRPIHSTFGSGFGWWGFRGRRIEWRYFEFEQCDSCV